MEIALIAVTVLVIYVAWDRRRHPYRPCPRCRRAPGRKLSAWNGQAYGVCRRCRGTGEIPRFGMRGRS